MKIVVNPVADEGLQLLTNSTSDIYNLSSYTGFDSRYPAVTLGTPNGLSLIGQQLSLGLASSGVTGALSGTDWNTFNGKQNALTFPISPTLGGTGVNNGTNLLTVPATGTVALLGTANVFTTTQTVQSATNVQELILRAKASQTLNIQEWQSNLSVVLGNVTPDGQLLFPRGTDSSNFFAGGAGNTTNTGNNNVAVGPLCLTNLTTGIGNMMFGSGAGYQITEGLYNTGIGTNALRNLTTGSYNMAFGFESSFTLVNGESNVSVGKGSLRQNSAGDQNVAIGQEALRGITGSRNVGVGFCAGYRSGAISDLLVIDNRLRASVAVETTNAILYGTMASTPANQTLRINAALTIGSTVAGALIIGVGTAGIDYQLKFDGEINDGLLTWMEDENYFTSNTPIHGATSLYRRYYHIALGAANPGASGATFVEAGANTTGGWRLTNATWILRGQADIHPDWDGASDMTVGVNFMVNVDNTGGAVGDTVDLRLNAYYKGLGDTVTKTQAVEVATTVGQSPQYKQFRALFTLDWDATSNVIEVGDIIAFVLNLETDTSEVDDIVITSMEFSYNTTHSSIESGDI